MTNGLKFEGGVADKAFDLAYQFGRLSIDILHGDSGLDKKLGAPMASRLGEACLNVSADLLHKLNPPDKMRLERRLGSLRLYTDWSAKSFEALHDRPFTYSDAAIITFLEEYLNGARKPEHLANKAASNINNKARRIQALLAERGLKFTRFHCSDKKQVYIYCNEIGKQVELEDIDLSTRPTEAELIQIGRKLRAGLPFNEIGSNPVLRSVRERPMASRSPEEILEETKTMVKNGLLAPDHLDLKRKKTATILLRRGVSNPKFRVILTSLENDITGSEIAARIGEPEAAIDELLENLSARYL